jgi:hypothetical protein
MMLRKQSHWNRWVVIGAIVVAMGLCGLTAAMFYVFVDRPQQDVVPTAVLQVIAAPSTTPTQSGPQVTATASVEPGSENGIARGMYVQITGTDGQGLRIRSGPGTTNDSKFLGMDSEVFKITDGPVHSDGMTWWYLVAPYDSTRSGWAAANYLNVVTNPEQ